MEASLGAVHGAWRGVVWRGMGRRGSWWGLVSAVGDKEVPFRSRLGEKDKEQAGRIATLRGLTRKNLFPGPETYWL